MDNRFGMEMLRLSGLLDLDINGAKSIQLLKSFPDRESVEKILFNRQPSLLIDRAFIFQDIETLRTFVVSELIITEKHCEGHYPGYPLFPFAQIGEMMAQTGAILLVVANHDMIGNNIPLVVKVEQFKSGNSGPLVPGDIMRSVAEVVNIRGGFAQLSVVAVIRDETIAIADKISYWAVNLPLNKETQTQ